MNTAIFHSVNCGLYVYVKETGLFIDGLHKGNHVGFSSTPPCLQSQLQNQCGFFQHMNGILFTHLHEDHYDPDALRIAAAVKNPPVLYAPQLKENSVSIHLLESSLFQFKIEQLLITALPTIHDGNIFRDCPHNSFLISAEKESIFVAGDAILSETQAELLSKCCNSHVDAAFFNLYQLSSPDGIAFAKKLSPKQIFLYHLPFPEDDTFNYLKQAQQVLKHWPDTLPAVEILKHMAWIDDKIPAWAAKQTFNPTMKS